DTQDLLADLDLERDAIDRVQRVSQGLPAYVAEVRRRILAGVSASDLIGRLPAALTGLFELDWERLVPDTETRFALSLVAFAPEPITTAEWQTIGKFSTA